MVAQDTYARKQYARKHFSRAYGDLYLVARGVRHLVRSVGRGGGVDKTARREGARRALLTLTGRIEPPFGSPPVTAIEPSKEARPTA